MAQAAAAKDDFIEVVSSNIHSWSYDPARKVITVRFHNGGQYEHPNCDARAWEDCKRAKSAGKHYAAQLKGQPYKKIDDWK